ncbi:hypothetical protein [Psychrobacillus sp. MER TA 171]|uniref:hypothetical protein n=1 Tax=Psychrobacillus sp. MER TA 171 TaxID=2939577 RepID=UPI00203CCE57|nr:hypothetical protein [Psychrobacillus sp. MER TA 171]MCM3358670.1 hypothetical protein [Psychrobacillus sp. MER TA 171]
MEILTVAELESKPFEELMSYFDAMEKETLDFQLHYVEIDELLLTKGTLPMDDLKVYFDMDHDNRKYTFPIVNEYDSYKKKMFLGHQILPPKGFLWKFNIKTNHLSFGVVDVVFEVVKMGLATDMKHWSDKLVFKQEYPFYYDFDSKEYVQVNPPTKKKDVPTVEYLEYQNRKNLHLYFEKRLEKENYVYQLNLEKASKTMGHGRLYTVTEINSVRNLFRKYLEFMENNKRYFKIKVRFNQIDQEHYDKLIEHVGELKRKVEEEKLLLDELEAKGYKEFMTVELHNDSVWRKEMERILETKNSIVKLFRYRDKNDVYFRKTDGYFTHTDKRLFENPVLIEVENCKSIYSETRTGRQIEKTELLEILNKKKP